MPVHTQHLCWNKFLGNPDFWCSERRPSSSPACFIFKSVAVLDSDYSSSSRVNLLHQTLIFLYLKYFSINDYLLSLHTKLPLAIVSKAPHGAPSFHGFNVKEKMWLSAYTEMTLHLVLQPQTMLRTVSTVTQKLLLYLRKMPFNLWTEHLNSDTDRPSCFTSFFDIIQQLGLKNSRANCAAKTTFDLFWLFPNQLWHKVEHGRVIWQGGDSSIKSRLMLRCGSV